MPPKCVFSNVLCAVLLCNQRRRAIVPFCHGDSLKTSHYHRAKGLEELSCKAAAIKPDLVLGPLPQFSPSQWLAVRTGLSLNRNQCFWACFKHGYCFFLDRFKICCPRIIHELLGADSLCLRLKSTTEAQLSLSPGNYRTPRRCLGSQLTFYATI